MKCCTKILSVLMILLLLLGLTACGKPAGGETTVPSTTAEPTTEATEPIDPAVLYADALEALYAKNNRVQTIEYRESRLVGGETYTESVVSTASYAGLTDDGGVEALVSEEITFGSYEVQYIQSYIGGSAYCRVNNYNFTCEMDAGSFIDSQIPAVLLDASLYTDITLESTDDSTIITFRGATAPEAWAQDSEYAQLANANGTAVLDSDGNLLSTAYHAEYTISTAAYTLDVTVAVETPDTLDLSARQPVYPESCRTLGDLRIPRLLLQVVGDVYTSEKMSVSYSDTLYSEAFAVVRSQTGQYYTYGAAEDFQASIATQVSLTNYTGTPVTNSQVISYADGIYSYSLNGADATTAEDISPEQVRTACEDAILASLFNLEYISTATLTDTGDFLYIDFTGNEDYAESLCDSIYTLLSLDLDSYAAAYETTSAGGYLTVNRHTGLPTALGMYLGRSHSIEGVDYVLTYQLDQNMTLSSPTAYESLTGESEPEAAPAETAKPLFYKVTDDNGHTMWLLGTIHIGDARTGFLPDEIIGALLSSDALAAEYDLIAFEETILTDTALQTQLAQCYYYSDGSLTSAHLGTELYTQTYPLFLATGSNNINGTYMNTGVWNNLIENLYLAQGSTLLPGKGVDRRLLTIAKENDIPVYEIESGISQVQMLTGFSDELQNLLLQQTLDMGMIPYCEEIEVLYELWCQGDEAALTEALATDLTDAGEAELEYYTAMMTDRNALMCTAAKTYLESGETVFYAVGLAHLLGEDGLVQQLRDAGYTVELVS